MYCSYTPRLPALGETIHGHRFSVGFGGKGANQCIAATRLGATTAMVAMVGDDSFGQNYLQNFHDNGVNISHVGVTSEAATGVAPIAVDDAGDNCIIIIAGANLKMTAANIEKAEKMVKESTVVVCQGEITSEATLAALVMARKHNVTTLMNAAPADANLDPAIIENSVIFCVNESEAEVLTKIQVKRVEDAQLAAKILLTRGCRSVVITLGGDGAVYSTLDEHIYVPADKVTPVDTTGAGDAFVGALAYFLAYHPQLTMEEMMQRSCKIASVSVQAAGTQSSYPTRDKLPSHLFV
ncbi:ribokinase-like isoform X2 [Homarus americanus]|uniref:ribokinase-like isoform X2 n=1 Tax=Homarus americanus TaxID=6706 RepID=UPI001C44F03A|nr:ribokinase-like isoform X2 [Homarus americanus]